MARLSRFELPAHEFLDVWRRMKTGTHERPHRVGVIGESGVGKSTLLNALISERLPLLPRGGVGPLTAVPIEIRHATNPYLRVGFWGMERIVQMLEACERALASDPSFTPTDAILVRLATQLASGSQFGRASIVEVHALLRECCGSPPRVGRDLAWAERVTHIRRLVAAGDAGRPIHIEAGVDLPGVMAALTEYGSGPLAPITASLDLGWDAPTLANNLVLVDLPGLGVANDLHPLTTHTVAGSMQTFLLVVDRSGLTEAGAKFLRRALATPQPTTLGDAESARELIVAVTKLDQVVSEMSARAPTRQRWEVACRAVAHRMRELVGAQLERELLRGNPLENSVLTRAMHQAHVAVVFPVEYQRLHRADPDDPARMQHGEATGIPALMAQLRVAASRRRS